jgi:response regulator of citrate/malate metabolism
VTRVVVVDDDYMVVRVHSAFVERVPGFEVVGTASDGAGALRAVRELLPDVVLLDVYMPDMTGLEVLQALRASAGPEADVDVLVVTAADDAESVRRALRGGAGGYLIKPFHAEDLRRRLEHLVSVRRRLAELEGRSGSDQAQVDRLLSPGLPHDGGSPLPKGLSPETTVLVQRVLREAGPDGLSATECAERTGLSRVSARRYLEHFSRTGSAEVSARYGGTGRPERRFRAP